MKKLMAVMVIACMAAPAVVLAGPGEYNVRGDMNGWGETLMTDNLDGTFTASFNGLAPNSSVPYKVAEDLDSPNDWDNAWPRENWYGGTDGAGDLTVTFDTNVIGDGWEPSSHRVYSPDPGADWEVIGDFTDWDVAPVGAPAQGGGLYSVDITIAAAGAHSYKFRAPGDWGRQIADPVSGSSNIEFSTTNPNETWRFELDIPNGRWRQTLVPEPASLALLGLGAIALMRRRR